MPKIRSNRSAAKRFKATYNRARLLNDPVYNMQMGAAELSMLLKTYDDSYLLTFAAYNAGRGRIRQWIGVYGDPRDPKAPQPKLGPVTVAQAAEGLHGFSGTVKAGAGFYWRAAGLFY